MLQSRLNRILFFTFAAPIIFTFYLFYSNQPSNLQHVDFYANHRSYLLRNNKTYNVQQFLNNRVINIFLDYAKKISIQPFLLEPFLLFNYLNEENQKYFLSKNLNPNVFKFRYDFNTFGIKVPYNFTGKERVKFLEGICNKELLEEKELDCNILYGEDNSKEWQLNEKIEDLKPEIPISFLFTYKLNNQKVHLVLFFLRTQSLWTGKINDTFNVSNLVLNEGANFHFNRYEELFDNFSLINYVENILIPKDPFTFLMEKNNSRLIECDRKLATTYYEKYSNKDFKKSKFVRKSLTNIYYFKEMMKEFKMPFWMSSGTLLGWYRQCNIISYTTDIDFAADSRFASEELTDKVKHNKFNFKFLYIWGIVSNGYEYSLTRSGYKADLFFVYPASDDRVAIFGHTVSSYNRYFYPKFDLCAGQLRGIRLNVPCNAKDLLEIEYGENWTKPVSNWNYISSPHNKGPTEYWPKGLVTLKRF